MAGKQYTVSELAQTLRARPGGDAYADIPDDVFVQRFIERNPEYSDILKPESSGAAESSGTTSPPLSTGEETAPSFTVSSPSSSQESNSPGFFARFLQRRQPGDVTRYEAMDPAEAARQDQQENQAFTESVGRLVPQAAAPALAAATHKVIEPFNNFVGKTANAFGDAAVEMAANPPSPTLAPQGLSGPPVEKVSIADYEKQHPISAGITRSVGQMVGGIVADPRQWPLLFVGGAEVRPLFAKMMSAGFGTQMTSDALEAANDLKKNWDKYTPAERSEKITTAGLTGLFAAMSAAHVGADSGVTESQPEQAQMPKAEDVTPVTDVTNVTPSPMGGIKGVLRPSVPQAADMIGEGASATQGATSEPVTPQHVEDYPSAPVESGVPQPPSGALRGKPLPAEEPQTVTPPEAPEPEFRPGPGAQTQSSFDEVGLSPMQQLTRWLPNVTSPKQSPVERMKAIQGAVQAKAGYIVDNLSRHLANAESSVLGLWDAYRRPPEWTSFDDAIGQWQGARQYNAVQLQNFAGELKNAIPDSVRREAITNYLQAGGDEAVLRARADASKAQFKRGYATAVKLSPEERILADNVRGYLDAQLAEAQRAGLLEQGVQDYISQIWEKSPEQAQQLQAANAASELSTKPYFTRERLFKDYFEGEQKGFQPASKDVGFLLSTYEKAFGKALADRGLIKQLLNANASDGRPLVQVSGAGRTLTESEMSPDARAHLILPHAKGESAADYIPIDAPAMRKWKWVAKDDAGKSIFLEGDVLAHPEIAKKLKNILTPSAIQTSPIGRAALKLSTEFKNTLLSMSAFHQVQLGIHGMEHLVNPVRLPKMDLEDTTQRALVDHGLMVASFDAHEAFSEGLNAGSGLVTKIPGIGKRLAAYQDYLFKDYLPRLKMAMAEHALERNTKRYSDQLTRDQILRLTAEQANAAFGHLNYSMLGRNRTMQDLLRLSLLAPDFLEARGRFVGQALKPYGREQSRALLTGAAAMYVGARVLNQVLNGNSYANDPKMAFSVRVKNRTYALRTVQGDILQLLTKPREFVEHRLNPITMRPLLEAITGKDTFGRDRTGKQQVQDFAGSVLPIPLQGLRSPGEFDIKESAAKSVGLTATRYRSPAAQKAHEFVTKGATFSESSRSPQEQQLIKRYRSQIDAGKFNSDSVRADYRAGKLTARDAKELMSENTSPQLVRDFKRLPIEKALQVWGVADANERKQLGPILAAKARRQLPNRVPSERVSLKQQVQQVLSR